MKGELTRLDALLVTGNFFAVLGVDPVLGRTLEPADDREGAEPVAVVSHGFWEQWLGSDPAAIEGTIGLGDGLFRIVGVLPPEFDGPVSGASVAVYVPHATQGLIDPRRFEMRDRYWGMSVLAWVSDGVSDERLQTTLEVALRLE